MCQQYQGQIVALYLVSWRSWSLHLAMNSFCTDFLVKHFTRRTDTSAIPFFIKVWQKVKADPFGFIVKEWHKKWVTLLFFFAKILRKTQTFCPEVFFEDSVIYSFISFPMSIGSFPKIKGHPPPPLPYVNPRVILVKGPKMYENPVKNCPQKVRVNCLGFLVKNFGGRELTSKVIWSKMSQTYGSKWRLQERMT